MLGDAPPSFSAQSNTAVNPKTPVDLMGVKSLPDIRKIRQVCQDDAAA